MEGTPAAASSRVSFRSRYGMAVHAGVDRTGGFAEFIAACWPSLSRKAYLLTGRHDRAARPPTGIAGSAGVTRWATCAVP